MGRKGQSGCNAIVGTDVVVNSRILVANSELRASLQARVVWKLAHIPCCKACWISIILSLPRVTSAIEIPMKVEFLSWIILMDILAGPHQIVYAVLDAEDTASIRILSYANRVAESPAKNGSSGCIVEGSCV